MKNLIQQINYTVRNHNATLQLNQSPSTESIRLAIRLVMRDNPDIFWFAHQYLYDSANSTIHFQYTFSAERVKSIQQSINDVIENDFCLGYVKTLTAQEQIAYVYKWLVSYCNYNANSAYNQSIYSVFVRRNSVCTGYAKAAQFLLNLLGIESRLVFGRLHNDKENGRHCWNIVKVDNQYYHCDTCFGDNILDSVALKSGVHELFKIDGINYNFLCVSTDEILKTRSIEDIASLPICPFSWSEELVKSLAKTKLRQRDEIIGCLLSNIGSTADIKLCTKDKNTILKVFSSDCWDTSRNEFKFMQQTKGCKHTLQCNEQFTDLSDNIIAIEQSTPIVDLLCSHYYELSLKGLIKIVTDVAMAWKECQIRGVLYRDIHVCNIYRSNDGIFKLGDFGSCTNNFQAKEVIGSQWFISPETFVSGIFTESSAVYSISMVMYFILNNLRPAFWEYGCEEEALKKRMNGQELPMPFSCVNLPSHINTKLDIFFRSASTSLPGERIRSITNLIHELEKITYCCGDCDYIIHNKGIISDFDLDAKNSGKLDGRFLYISRDLHHRYAMGNETKDYISKYDAVTVDSVEDFASTALPNNYDSISNTCLPGNGLIVEEVERFATTMAFAPDAEEEEEFSLKAKRTRLKKKLLEGKNITLNYREPVPEFGNAESTVGIPTRKLAGNTQYEDIRSIEGRTYEPKSGKIKKSLWNKIFGNKYNDVYSSIFAPSEIKPKSHMMVQVYLHVYEETEKVKSLAKEVDKKAERRDYIPLLLKLRKGDKVDVEFNVYGETRLMSERKSLIWQGSFTKCTFDYFVPSNIGLEELCCEANLFVYGAMIGEMKFITKIVETPRNLNPQILSHRFNRIFISYAHQDAQQIKLLALAYKAQGIDYFYDRDSLAPGDIYEEKIFEYIDSSDLFILCWSKNAAISQYVAKEKGRALLRAYPQLNIKDATLKICPISIEPRAELPDDMNKIYNFEII